MSWQKTQAERLESINKKRGRVGLSAVKTTDAMMIDPKAQSRVRAQSPQPVTIQATAKPSEVSKGKFTPVTPGDLTEGDTVFFKVRKNSKQPTGGKLLSVDLAKGKAKVEYKQASTGKTVSAIRPVSELLMAQGSGGVKGDVKGQPTSRKPWEMTSEEYARENYQGLLDRAIKSEEKDIADGFGGNAFKAKAEKRLTELKSLQGKSYDDVAAKYRDIYPSGDIGYQLELEQIGAIQKAGKDGAGDIPSEIKKLIGGNSLSTGALDKAVMGLRQGGVKSAQPKAVDADRPIDANKADELSGKGKIRLDDYLFAMKADMGADYSSGMKSSFENEWYEKIEKHLKGGGEITQDIVDSMTSGQRYSWAKAFNYGSTDLAATKAYRDEAILSSMPNDGNGDRQSKPPHESTLPDFIQQEKDALIAKYPQSASKQMVLDDNAAKAKDKWVKALKEQAQKGRLSDDVIDSYESEYGRNALLSTFRGVAEKGIDGWIPPESRNGDRQSSPPKVEAKGSGDEQTDSIAKKSAPKLTKEQIQDYAYNDPTQLTRKEYTDFWVKKQLSEDVDKFTKQVLNGVNAGARLSQEVSKATLLKSKGDAFAKERQAIADYTASQKQKLIDLFNDRHDTEVYGNISLKKYVPSRVINAGYKDFLVKRIEKAKKNIADGYMTGSVEDIFHPDIVRDHPALFGKQSVKEKPPVGDRLFTPTLERDGKKAPKGYRYAELEDLQGIEVGQTLSYINKRKVESYPIEKINVNPDGTVGSIHLKASSYSTRVMVPSEFKDSVIKPVNDPYPAKKNDHLFEGFNHSSADKTPTPTAPTETKSKVRGRNSSQELNAMLKGFVAGTPSSKRYQVLSDAKKFANEKGLDLPDWVQPELTRAAKEVTGVSGTSKPTTDKFEMYPLKGEKIVEKSVSVKGSTTPKPFEPNYLGRIPTDAISFDPSRFQYKVIHGPTGASGSLSGIKKWNESASGVLMVWKDPGDGKTYVVNGHNRATLAKNLNVETLPVKFIDAKNANEARAAGAIANIAEGRGNPIDAAKFFRDSKMSRQDLEELGIPMQEAIAQKGAALANLPEHLFMQVYMGSMPVERAVQIGCCGLSHAQQDSLAKMIESQDKKGRNVTNAMVSELVDTVKASGTTQTQTLDLFGNSIDEKSLAIEVAGLQAFVKRKLGRDKKLFGSVSRSSAAKDLERAGNEINVDDSAKIAKEADIGLITFDQFKNLSSPVSKALNEGARRIVNGESRKKVEDDIYQEITKILPTLLPNGQGKGSGDRQGVSGGSGRNEPDNQISLFSERNYPITKANGTLNFSQPRRSMLAVDPRIAKIKRRVAEHKQRLATRH